MINLLIVNESMSSSRNGIGSYLKQLCKCLKEDKDIRQLMITFNSNCQEVHFEEKSEGNFLYFPKKPNSVFVHYHKTITRFLKLYLKDSKHNIFMFNYAHCWNLVDTIKKHFPLSKVICTVHDFSWSTSLDGSIQNLRKCLQMPYEGDDPHDPQTVRGVFRFENKMFHRANRVICLNQESRKILVDYYQLSDSHVTVIPNALKDTYHSFSTEQRKELYQQNHLDRQDQIILFVGRLTEMKGIIALLESFRIALKQNHHLRLAIAGQTTDLSKLHISDIASHIIQLGFLNHQELEQWYQIAEIGIIPSYSEQCSYVGIEMMMHHLPLVTSDAYGLRDMFQDKENALLAPIGNHHEQFVSHLAECIIKLMSSASERERLAKQARRTYLERYQIGEMKQKYTELFHSVYQE